MSNLYLTWAFVKTESISHTEKLVLIKLADQCNDDGVCWPAQDTIAKHCCLSRQTVNKTIKKLEEKGVIVIEQRFRSGMKTSHKYRLFPDVNLRDIDVKQSDTRCKIQTIPDVKQVYINPHIEPSIEPSLSFVPNDVSDLKTDVDKAVYNWNVTAAPLGLAKVTVLNASRRKKLNARLSEVGLDGWITALEVLERDKFCQGHNPNGWKADFDFMLRPDKLLKMIEGGYRSDD